MQRSPTFFSQQSHDDDNDLTRKIQSTFYNTIIDVLFKDGEIKKENLQNKITLAVGPALLTIIKNSSDLDKEIRLYDGTLITNNNCPSQYKPFFTMLLLLKDDLKRHQNVSASLMTLVTRALELETVKQILPRIKNSVLEANHSPTPELIRETFYNEMANQLVESLEKNWISLDHLREQEPFLFFALPALTILQALRISEDCEGIRLRGNIILTEDNCPDEEGFRSLFLPILQNKNNLSTKTDEQLKLIRQLCLSKNEEIPPELSHLQTHDTTACVIPINEIASQISRRRLFHNKIGEIIQNCLAAYGAVEETASMIPNHRFSNP